jgi:Zn-dependent protease
MGIFLFLFILWITGFLITVVHELGHAIFSGGEIEYIQIGIPIGNYFILGKFRVYPLFPVAGGTRLTIENPTKCRIVMFASAGIIIGSAACVLAGIIGFNLLPPEAMSEIINTHRLRFLLKDVVAGTASSQTSIATAFITSSILYGVQQIGNLFPVPGYDGYQLLRTQSYINQITKFK